MQPVRTTIVVLSVLLSAALLLGRGRGTVSGKGMPNNLTRAFPSCGSCHTSSPHSNVKMSIAGATTASPGSIVALRATVGGANNSSRRGGFTLEASAGAFRAGTNTRVDTTRAGQSAVTHANSLSRSWSFSWAAPTQPGLVEMFGVGNAVNGDGKDKGDFWGWHGPSSVTPGTPHRVFVNARGVASTGSGCAGTDAFVPLLGMRKVPAVNSTWETEAYNLPPSVASIGILGLSNTKFGALPLPLPLAALGAPKCTLRVSLDVLQVAITQGAGSGNGVAKIRWLVPNDASLRGLKLFFQQMTVDSKANKFGFTFSNALSTAVQ